MQNFGGGWQKDKHLGSTALSLHTMTCSESESQLHLVTTHTPTFTYLPPKPQPNPLELPYSFHTIPIMWISISHGFQVTFTSLFGLGLI